uniref:Uncharacterized protein n=1 Tax=Rhizophora mucronata TaxID=61149 RepID=A0A2P2Q5V6_RHIMU
MPGVAKRRCCLKSHLTNSGSGLSSSCWPRGMPSSSLKTRNCGGSSGYLA